MKAIRYYAYGPPSVLTLQDVGMPAVGDDDVLVRVRAAAVNAGDWHYMRGMPYIFRAMAGLTRPKANGLGNDFAGEVEAVGKNVTALQPGDEVFGYGEGALAEYVSVRHDAAVLKKPGNLTFEQAAAVPTAATTALLGLRDKGRVQPGRRVLINGASGGVGTFAVQIAKTLGAEVTGVCSTGNVDLVRSIGADRVLDYTKEDFTRDTRRYDVILDNIGNHPLSACRRLLTPRGTFIPNFGTGGRWVGPMNRLIAAKLLSLFIHQKVANYVAIPRKDDLAALHDLLQDGKIAPVIDRTYPLTEAPEAIRYLEEGHAKGKIVVTV
ncbi:NAD(P)-dependent alcohol dehydrogenase [Nonomuraea basaltis]|uniref:NAD(P)-dependent alcohol dehydrogenase n=1 Tax=Nonomuraea basaltis TaxID=2495887 RepID=UPI00110C4F63|nr:NAD(P)-dependent alcohol dehydrogenase [Nonomuraea basaltis]TMR91820.1 NAD(P)-dependent alcohol dehydrogenase [Nonomuraea basaltis]